VGVVLLLLRLRLQALPPPLPPPPLSLLSVLILPPPLLLHTFGVHPGGELPSMCKLGARDGGQTGNCEDWKGEGLLRTTEGLHTLVLLLLIPLLLLLLLLLLEPPRQLTTGCVGVGWSTPKESPFSAEIKTLARGGVVCGVDFGEWACVFVVEIETLVLA
jgi:hypothetical protein